MKKQTCLVIGLIFLGAMATGAALLAIPLLPAQTNPPVVKEPTWDNPETRALAQRACFDCHSNETVWPWYSRSLGASWLVLMDVREGREQLNFSNWGAKHQGEDGEGGEHNELGEVVMECEMPPIQYLLMHPEARLTSAEKQQLAAGLSTLN